MFFNSFTILAIFATIGVGESSQKSPMKILLRQKRSTCPAKFQHISGHTACISRSANYISGGVTNSEKEDLLKYHNDYRAGVSPTAKNMLKMTWDDEIAMLAQKWAENCVWGHDNNYKRYIPGRFSVGQNLYTVSGDPDPPKNWQKAIKAWYDEVVDFSYGSGGSGSTNGKAVGHYTQVVWATSSKLGCGYAKCTNMDGFYVCNYGPAGNSISSRSTPYKSGSSCADCGSTCSNKLCDCGSKVCYNGGTMNVNTCGCTCKTHAFIIGSSCALQCEGSTDPSYCGVQFKKADCPTFSNYPYDCPNMCETCPHGSTDVSDSTTTTSGEQPTTTSTEQTVGQTTTTTLPPVATTGGSSDVSDSTRTTITGNQPKTTVQKPTTVKPSATTTTAEQQTTTTSFFITTTDGSADVSDLTTTTPEDQPTTTSSQQIVGQTTPTTLPPVATTGGSPGVSDRTTVTEDPTTVEGSATTTTAEQQTTTTSSFFTTTDQPTTSAQQPTTKAATSTVKQRTTAISTTFSIDDSNRVSHSTIITSGDKSKTMVQQPTTVPSVTKTMTEKQTTMTSSSITTTVESEDHTGHASGKSPPFVMVALCLISAKAVKILL